MFYTNLCSKVFLSKSKSPLYSFKNLIFNLFRSTDRSTDSMSGLTGRPCSRPRNWQVHVSVCMFYGRPSGRPTVTHLLSGCLGRPGGRPLACNGHIFELQVDRAVDRGIRLNSKRLFFLSCFILSFCV